MSILVFYKYDYWGDNGRYYEDKIEEYDTEQEAISDCAHIGWYAAIEGTFKVTRVVGGEEGLLDRINQAVVDRIKAEKVNDEITKLKRSIADDQKWLDTVVEETEKRKVRLALNIARLGDME